MVFSGVSVFFIPLIHNKYENLGISCVFGAVSTVGWNSLDVLSAELFPTSVRYVDLTFLLLFFTIHLRVLVSA